MNSRILKQPCTLGVLAAVTMCTAGTVLAQELSQSAIRTEDFVREGIAGATCGGTAITQNTNPDMITANSVACAAAGPPQTTTENAWARSYSIASATTVNCVDFAVQTTSGVAGGNWPVRVRLYSDSTGGPPDVASLTQLGPDVFVPIPNGTTNQFFTANFPGGVAVPAGTTLVVELFVACRQTTCTTNPPGFPSTGDGAVTFMGSNNLGQSAPTYLKTGGPCGATDYINLNTIPGCAPCVDSHVIQVLGTGPPPNECLFPLPSCPQDVAVNGAVDVQDLLAVINTWGQVGPPRPQGDCAPPPNGDCTVDVQDLLAVINRWGACPAASGACCTNGNCTFVTESACLAGGGAYQGDNVQCASVVCPVTPVNDECVDATAIPCGTTVVTAAEIAGGTVAPGDPNTSCELAQPGSPFLKESSLWYSFTTGPAQTGLSISACNSPNTLVDNVLGVYTACGGNEIACWEDECTAPTFGLGETACFNVQPNTEYIILLQRYSYAGNPVGDVHLTLDCTCTPPSNDECVGAQALTINGPGVSDTLSTATTDAGFPTCNGIAPGVGRWYTVVGNGTTLSATTCASPFEFWDGAINVYCGGSCGDLVCVAGVNADTCPNAPLQETVSWCSAPAAANQTYWILVHSQSGTPGDGNYTLNVTSGAACGTPLSCDPQVNDSCQNALPINLGTTAFATMGASTDGVPSAVGVCDDFGQNDTHNDIWYTFTAPQSGALQVTTCSQLGGSSNYDSDLVLYSNSAPGGATCPPADSARIACNDDDQNNPCGTAAPFSSTMVGQVTAGNQYRIRVGGWGAADEGSGVLNLSMQNFVCGNGTIEPGEQCDDPGPGCVNCQLVPNCGAACAAIDPEPCLVDNASDTTNGGCNSTPAVFGSAIAGQTKCGTVSTYLFGTAQRRDTDWHAYTVGPSGNVRVDFRSQIPTVSFLILSGTACPGANVVGLGWSDDNNCATYQVNNLTPGQTIVVFFGPGNPDGSGVFTGFPCGNPDGNNYEFTVTSPVGSP